MQKPTSRIHHRSVALKAEAVTQAALQPLSESQKKLKPNQPSKPLHAQLLPALTLNRFVANSPQKISTGKYNKRHRAGDAKRELGRRCTCDPQSLRRRGKRWMTAVAEMVSFNACVEAIDIHLYAPNKTCHENKIKRMKEFSLLLNVGPWNPRSPAPDVNIYYIVVGFYVLFFWVGS